MGGLPESQAIVRQCAVFVFVRRYSGIAVIEVVEGQVPVAGASQHYPPNSSESIWLVTPSVKAQSVGQDLHSRSFRYGLAGRAKLCGDIVSFCNCLIPCQSDLGKVLPLPCKVLNECSRIGIRDELRDVEYGCTRCDVQGNGDF